MTAQAILSTQGLTKVFAGVPAVDDVTFSVAPGEVVGFVGLNGAGKSTTINMLLGFQNPTRGSVTLFGEQLTLPNAHNSHHDIGFATGDMTLFDSMTGAQYLAFVARMFGGVDADYRQALIDRFEPQLNKKIRNLSRGNRQKIALIAAFMPQPKLIILDEPSSGLDPLMQQRFIELVQQTAEAGQTVFMSSHYLEEVVEACSRVLLIKKGKLVKDIAASELVDAAGKQVKVTTKRKVSPPHDIEQLEVHHSQGLHHVSFIYKGNALRLQQWLSSLPNVVDFTVADHDPVATFDELYRVEEPDHV